MELFKAASLYQRPMSAASYDYEKEEGVVVLKVQFWSDCWQGEYQEFYHYWY